LHAFSILVKAKVNAESARMKGRAQGTNRDRTRGNSDGFEEFILECSNTWLGNLLFRKGERESGLMMRER
jgi:hypothetical protein